MEGRDEEEAFRSLDADRMDRFNVFLLFYYQKMMINQSLLVVMMITEITIQINL